MGTSSRAKDLAARTDTPRIQPTSASAPVASAEPGSASAAPAHDEDRLFAPWEHGRAKLIARAMLNRTTDMPGPVGPAFRPFRVRSGWTNAVSIRPLLARSDSLFRERACETRH
jgi:hypothetical protein